MFQEVLKIVPKVDGPSLNKMFDSMNLRFVRITKTFGKGLVTASKTAFKSGAILSGLSILIDKFLNPLKETQEALERTLGTSANIKDYSEQFNTTTGNLFKLQMLAKAKGVDDQTLYGLINKFQASVIEAKADPNKATSVRQYTDTTDYAEGFFKFIQNLQSLSKDDQYKVQSEIFGEKQLLKTAAFLNESNFAGMTKALGLGQGSKYSSTLEKSDRLDDRLQLGRTKNEITSMMNLGKIANDGMISSILSGERRKDAQIEYNARNFNAMANVQKATDEINKGVQQIITSLGNFAMEITRFKDMMKDFSFSDLTNVFSEIKNEIVNGFKKMFGK